MVREVVPVFTDQPLSGVVSSFRLAKANDDDRLTTSHSTCFSSQSELICLDLDVRLVIIWATVGELRICCITGHR